MVRVRDLLRYNFLTCFMPQMQPWWPWLRIDDPNAPDWDGIESRPAHHFGEKGEPYNG